MADSKKDLRMNPQHDIDNLKSALEAYDRRFDDWTGFAIQYDGGPETEQKVNALVAAVRAVLSWENK